MRTAHIYGWDSMFIPYSTGNITSWLTTNLKVIPLLDKYYPHFIKFTLWIPQELYSGIVIPACDLILAKIQPTWDYCTHSYNTAEFNDGVTVLRVGIAIFQALDDSMQAKIKHSSADNNFAQLGYSHYIHQDLNREANPYSVPLPIGILDHSDCNPHVPITTPLTVAIINDAALIPYIVLHLLYPCKEPISIEIINNVGGVFG